MNPKALRRCFSFPLVLVALFALPGCPDSKKKSPQGHEHKAGEEHEHKEGEKQDGHEHKEGEKHDDGHDHEKQEKKSGGQ